MDPEDLKERTMQFSLRVARLIEALPRRRIGRLVEDQLGRAGTSVGANYRAACKARSRKEFIAKMGTVEEESDESCFWLEFIVRSGMLKARRVEPLLKESRELGRIFAASRITAQAHESKRRLPTPAAANRQQAMGTGQFSGVE
jgi:four helix bundle protein